MHCYEYVFVLIYVSFQVYTDLNAYNLEVHLYTTIRVTGFAILLHCGCYDSSYAVIQVGGSAILVFRDQGK